MTKERLLEMLAELKAQGKNPHGYLRELLIDMMLDEQNDEEN